MSAERYRSEPQQAVLAIYHALGERPLAGKTPGELESELGLSRDQAFRALQNLALSGDAEQLGERGAPWRLTRKATLLSEHVRVATADYLRTHLGDPR